MKIFIKGIYNVIWFFKIRILNISIIFLIFSDVKMTAKREQKKSNVFMYSGFSVDSYLFCYISALFSCFSRKNNSIFI